VEGDGGAPPHRRGRAGAGAPAGEAWERRRREYVSWLEDGSGLLFLARREGADDVIGYAMCRLLPSAPLTG
jgi:hypothetical protein